MSALELNQIAEAVLWKNFFLGGPSKLVLKGCSLGCSPWLPFPFGRRCAIVLIELLNGQLIKSLCRLLSSILSAALEAILLFLSKRNSDKERGRRVAGQCAFLKGNSVGRHFVVDWPVCVFGDRAYFPEIFQSTLKFKVCFASCECVCNANHQFEFEMLARERFSQPVKFQRVPSDYS